ncbi:MAG TPA: hypothetical protein VGH99_06960 [Pseudonocardia sp.]
MHNGAARRQSVAGLCALVLAVVLAALGASSEPLGGSPVPGSGLGTASAAGGSPDHQPGRVEPLSPQLRGSPAPTPPLVGPVASAGLPLPGPARADRAAVAAVARSGAGSTRRERAPPAV